MSSSGMPSESLGDRLAARSADVAARAIDQDVDGAELGLDLLLHLRHRGLVADVARHRDDPAAVAGDLLGDRPEVLRFAVFGRRCPGKVVDGKVRAKFSQTLGHDPAEPAP